MPDVLAMPVLVLNRYYEPVQVTSARRAFVLLYGGAARALEDGELYDFDTWRAMPSDDHPAVPVVSGSIRIPRVVHLNRYDKRPRNVVRLSRRNVMLRDAHQCQYCGKRPPVRDLNIDHVVPRSRGGGDTWENLVTACKLCNLKKGAKSPDDAGMRLLRPPVRPRWSCVARILLGQGSTDPAWAPFLESA